jgi:hypothetical protein
MDKPDLDRPGRPMTILIDDRPTDVEQTVRQNLQNLITAGGSEENVTPEALEAVGIDPRDWAYFVVEMIDTQRWTADHVLAYETNYEAWHGEPPPVIAELKARMRKDKLGLRHSDSEPADDE